MSKGEDRPYHLTPTGWQYAETRPSEAVMTVTAHEPGGMYGRTYWTNDWRSSDADAVKALTDKFGKKP